MLKRDVCEFRKAIDDKVREITTILTFDMARTYDMVENSYDR